MKNETLFRDADVEVIQPTDEERAADPNAEPRVSLSLSSEHPVERYDWMRGKKYSEILDHSREAVDLSYSKRGLPLLLDHDTRTQVGILENVRVGDDKKLRGDARFSKAQAGRDALQDVLGGIRKNVSVGYRVDRERIDIKTAEKDGERDTYRIKRWTPMEASIVAVPADITVGIGRAEGDSLPKELNDAIRVIERFASQTPTTAPQASKEQVVPEVTVADRDEAVKAERARGKEIRTLAATHKIDAAKAEKWIDEGRTVDQVAAEVLQTLMAEGRTPSGRPAVEFNDRERKNYSFVRAINARVAREEGRKVDATFETEVSDELERVAKASKIPLSGKGGILVPTFTSPEAAREIMALQNGGAFMARAGLDSATATKGQELKFTVPGEFLEILRNFMVTSQAGVTLLAGLQGPVAFPNQTNTGTATWVGENPGVDVADSNLLLGQIALAPKTVMSSTSYSRQLLAQAIVDVDALVKTDLARIMALAVDLAVIAGTGAANQPTGVLSTAGIGSVALGANGATPTYNNLVDLESQVTTSNADQFDLTHLIHTTSRGTFKKAVVLGNTAGKAVWTDKESPALASTISGKTSRKKGELNGYDAYATNQVPNNLTKGTSVGICLAIILGAWSQGVLGDWGMMEIIVDPYRLKKQGMVELTSFGMYGVAIKYAKAFAAIADALA
jgi:HK97 family phage major capsid protein